MSLRTIFYSTAAKNEPVRVFLQGLDKPDRLTVGSDIRVIQNGWPVGPPLCKPVSGYEGLWEVRSDISDGRIVRIYFGVANGEMRLVHAIIKKSQSAPKPALNLAKKRLKEMV